MELLTSPAKRLLQPAGQFSKGLGVRQDKAKCVWKTSCPVAWIPRRSNRSRGAAARGWGLVWPDFQKQPVWDLPGNTFAPQSLGRVKVLAAQSCPTLCNPMDCSPPGSSGVDCHFLLQGTFLTQGSNPGLLPCRQNLYQLSHQGSSKPGDESEENLFFWSDKNLWGIFQSWCIEN